jgi:hypothetical protein
MNPEEELGFVADDEIGFVEDAPAPRMQPTRRIVMGETTIEAGSPTRYDPSGERTQIGHAVDAGAPIAASPEPSWQERGKAAPTGPTVSQRARWEVAQGRTSDGGSTPSAAWDAFIGATPQAGVFGADVSGARARTGERAQSFWDQMVLGDAQLGGRNPIGATVGRDRRGEAPIAGVSSSLSLGFDDEAGGYLRSQTSGRSYEQERDALRQRSDEARSQAPQAFGVGEAIGALPAMAINPATAGGRVALGTALGALSGAGHSEQTGIGLAGDAAAGGLLGGGSAALGEAAGGGMRGPMRSLAGRFRRGAEVAQEGADQALLEASGFWGNRAIDQIDRAGGAASVASDFRRFNIGRGGGQRIPRMQQAADDLSQLGRGGGNTMELIAQTADEAGARIPASRVVAAAEREAQRLEHLGTDTARRAAQRIRREVAPLAQRPDMSLSDAWRLRRHFDSMADFSRGAGADDVARTAGEQFRALRTSLDREMDSALATVGLGQQWDEASRMAQLGIISDEAGAGFRRLSVGGGIGGATATGDMVADAVRTGNPLRVAAAIPQTVIARAAGQEARMVAPGMIAQTRQASADAQRSIADRLYDLARSQPQALGRFARPIMEAAARGSAALSATHFVLMQREREYRDLVEQLDAAEETE